MYPTCVRVDYQVISSNYTKLCKQSPSTVLVPVVKSDAYGHGLLETSRALMAAGATILAVFRLEEAIFLRKNGIQCRIWVLMGAMPEEAELAVQYDFTLVCFNMEQARALSQATVHDVTLHVAVDTGMGRLGFPIGQALERIQEIRTLPHLQVRGICSHVANATNPEHPVTRRQVEAFRSLLPQLPGDCTENHSCASHAWLNRLIPELNYARPGICLYMRCSLPDGTYTENAMSCTSRIISLKWLPKGYSISYGSQYSLSRDTLVGVAPLGYEDGYIRSLSNKTHALVHGQRVRLMGTICMSMCMFDLTDVANAQLNDEIVLLGKQGAEEITVEELAALAQTTEHEILCALGKKR